MFNKRLVLSTLFFLLCMIIIVLLKPPFLFNDDDGSIKEFGVGLDKTIYSLGVVVVTLSILSFYIFSMIDLMY